MHTVTVYKINGSAEGLILIYPVRWKDDEEQTEFYQAIDDARGGIFSCGSAWAVVSCVGLRSRCCID
jgi:hypothetical protein